ncbi:uncharacterized protein BN903_117 [Halorubrum sp. AJ67]|nr:uncharacterized protein BN903_117 [Halorubrum sp. AJ67]
MQDALDLEELVAVLLEEHEYGDSLKPKAFHKVLYFVEQELEQERVPVQVPKFWYMYGAVVATSNSNINVDISDGGSSVTSNLDLDDIDVSEGVLRRSQEAISRALDDYYDLGLDSITNKMYEEAPYDVQRHYRQLDKQLTAAADTGQMTLDGGKNEARTRETVYDLLESFPLDEFPEYENDLYIWYRLVSAQIDSDDYDPDEAHRISETFWRLFCLELACRENSRLSHSEVAEELGVDSIEGTKEELRSFLLEQEKQKARRNARESEAAIKAAEAFVAPHLEFDVKI